MRTLLRSIVLAALLAAPTSVAAQVAAGDSAGWNGPRALDLILRAQQRRAETTADTGLVNYQSQAAIRVYFYLDREDTRERNLVKTDQLALEVLWQAPDQVKQRIVGWRDEKSLPTNIRYHLDHLTVVQENFGDEIRLGDGDEVRGVPHPAARGAESFYQYRLADSLVLRLPGAAEPVSVYEVEVRPYDLRQPAFVGSVFVERRRGDLVRMDFTFTAASYVDRYLDYINISLDNGLWRGRYWLPNQQRVEIRRRIPQLDIPAGSVIRANMRIGGYVFNQPLPPLAFAGPAVVAAPRAQREAYEFEEGIFEEIQEEGLGPQVELGEIRRRAEQLAREQALRKITGVRLRLPRLSEVVRYNRAEGPVFGLGAVVAPAPGVRLGVLGGYAFGAEHLTASLELEASVGPTEVGASAYTSRARDVGVGWAASGAINTLASLFAGDDYLDLYYATGGDASLERPLAGGWRLAAAGRAERQESAVLSDNFSVFGTDFRSVREIDEGTFVGGSVGLARPIPAESGAGLGLELWMEGGRLAGRETDDCVTTGACHERDGAFLKPRAAASWRRVTGPLALEVDARAGASFGTLPRQELYLLGGRGTIPGYDFRAFGGDRFATLGAVASADLIRPWVRARLLGALGWSAVGDPGDVALRLWGVGPTGGVRPSVGVGVGLLYDILRLDLSRGLGDGGRWELIVEARPSFWDFL